MAKDVIELVPPELGCEELANAQLLTEQQSRWLLHDDICPFCQKKRIIYRPWRQDYICGWCHGVFKMILNRMYQIGNQLFME